MTPRQEDAFRAGIRHAAEQARIAAITLEIRPDAGEMRIRAAVEALRGLADGLRAETHGKSDNPVFEHGRCPQVEETSPSEGFHDLPVKPVPSREQAVAAGYTGDACGACGSFAMKWAGACLSCDACGSSSGCS